MVLSIHNHRSFHENRIWLRSDRWREDLQYLSHYVCSTTEYYEEKVSLLSTNLLKGTIKNSQQHFVICHTHTQYRGSICFQKILTSLHCRTIISSRYIREPRMLSSIRSQSKKNRIENFSLTQYDTDTRVLTPTKVVFTLYLRSRNEFQPFPFTLLFYF